jgi:hypothetical protein
MTTVHFIMAEPIMIDGSLAALSGTDVLRTRIKDLNISLLHQS